MRTRLRYHRSHPRSLCPKVNRTGDLFNLAYTNDKAPAPPKRDRGIADIGGLAGMAVKQEDEMSDELEGDALDNAVTLADAQATGLAGKLESVQPTLGCGRADHRAGRNRADAARDDA
jgi:hypothetical protein